METKQFTEIPLQKAEGEGKYSFVMSSTAPDRTGDTFSVKAYQSLMGKKLLALYSHDSEKPIGFWENMRVKGNKLIGDLSLAPTNLGKMLVALLDHGTPLMSSVGFKPKDYDKNDSGGYHFKDAEFLECSVVAVGMHQDAIRIAKSFGIELPVQEELDADVAESGEKNVEATLLEAKRAILSAQKSIRLK